MVDRPTAPTRPRHPHLPPTGRADESGSTQGVTSPASPPPAAPVTPPSSVVINPSQTNVMTPIAPPIAPPLFRNPSSNPQSVEALSAESHFKTQYAQVQARNNSPEFALYNRAQQALDSLKLSSVRPETTVAHQNVEGRDITALIEQSRHEIFEATLAQQEDRLETSLRAVTSLSNYRIAEKRQFLILKTLCDHYPMMSRPLRLAYTDNRNERTFPWDPTTATLNNLPIIKTYQRLRQSTRVEDQEAARAIETVVAEVYEPHTPIFIESIDTIETETTRLENLYGDVANPHYVDSFRYFFSEVDRTRQNDILADPAFQRHIALTTSITNLTTLARSIAYLQNHPSALTPNILAHGKNDVLQTLRTQVALLQEEAERLAASRPTERVWVEIGEAGTFQEVPGAPTPHEHVIEGEIATLRQQINHWQNLNPSSPEAAEELLPTLNALFASQERTVRHLLEGRGGRLASITEPSVEGRCRQYQQVLQEADQVTLRTAVQARIETFRAVLPSIQHSDRVLNSTLGTAFGASYAFTNAIERYQHVQELLNQGNFSEANRLFLQLEQSQAHTELADHQATASHINFGASVAIMTAAAFTMNAGMLALAPEFTLAATSAQAGYGMQMAYLAAGATLFTISHNAFDAALTRDRTILWNTEQSFGINARRYAGEIATNAAMMMLVGSVAYGFRQVTNARLALQAERELVQEGQMLEIGPRSLDELALITQRTQRLAEGLAIRSVLSLSQAGLELTALQSWGFATHLAEQSRQNRFDPQEAFQQTFGNFASWADQATFLIGMRVGHSLSAPLFGPINTASREIAIERLQGRLGEAQASVERAGESWRNFVTSGQGNRSLLFQTWRDALRIRQQLLEHPAIRDIRNAQTYAEGQALLSEMDHAEAEVVAQMEAAERNPERPTTAFYRNPFFALGFGLVGMGTPGAALFRGPRDEAMDNLNATGNEIDIPNIKSKVIQIRHDALFDNETAVLAFQNAWSRLIRAIQSHRNQPLSQRESVALCNGFLDQSERLDVAIHHISYLTEIAESGELEIANLGRFLSFRFDGEPIVFPRGGVIPDSPREVLGRVNIGGDYYLQRVPRTDSQIFQYHYQPSIENPNQENLLVTLTTERGNTRVFSVTREAALSYGWIRRAAAGGYEVHPEFNQLRFIRLGEDLNIDPLSVPTTEVLPDLAGSLPRERAIIPTISGTRAVATTTPDLADTLPDYPAPSTNLPNPNPQRRRE